MAGGTRRVLSDAALGLGMLLIRAWGCDTASRQGLRLAADGASSGSSTPPVDSAVITADVGLQRACSVRYRRQCAVAVSRRRSPDMTLRRAPTSGRSGLRRRRAASPPAAVFVAWG